VGRVHPKREVQPFVVDFYNWEAFQMFNMCATQWRYLPSMGEPIAQGLDYPSVLAVMEMHGILDKSDLFARVQFLEQGAIAARLGKPLEDLIHG
jgi:hypothetical protein